MRDIFGLAGFEPFTLFSLGHTISLLLIVFIAILLYQFRRELRIPKFNKWFRYSLAGVLLISDLTLHAWLYSTDRWTLDYALPLQLCSISLYCSLIMLLNKNYTIFEFTYLAGLGGAIQALVTPDLGHYTYPHFRTFQFFIAHGAIVLACVFMIFVEKYKPTLRSLWRAFVILNIISAVVGVMNWLTGGNYMFLARKPQGASLIDVLGPWPWYIISLEGVVVLSFFVFFSPFVVRNFYKRRKLKLAHHQGQDQQQL